VDRQTAQLVADATDGWPSARNLQGAGLLIVPYAIMILLFWKAL
jgi:hypothetical protein